MSNLASSTLTKFGVLSANPLAFLTVVAYALIWIIFAPDTLEWHGIATLATWMMTIFIQRSEHRDTQAIHAKLDDLLRANKNARSDLASIDEEEPETIENFRESRNSDQ